MHIVLAIGSLRGGGAERVLCIMADAWVERGYQVTILTFEQEDAVAAYPLSDLVDVVRLNLNTPVSNKLGALMRSWNSVLRLRATIRRLKPDVVVSFIDQVNILIVLACKGLSLPVIISERVHPAYHDIGRFWSILRRLVYNGATTLVVQTKDIADWFLSWCSMNVLIIPNPVRQPQKQWVENSQERPIVIAAGRLMHQKGFDLLIKAFARVADEFPEWDLIIHGEGEDRLFLEKLAVNSGVQDRVSFPGWTSDLAGALVKANVFCLSSRFEGFPNALSEAMSLGLPVLSTNCPSGPADMITDDKDGVLVQPDSIHALAQGLRRLMADAPLRSRLGASARSVSKRYRLERIVDMWDECIRHS